MTRLSFRAEEAGKFCTGLFGINNNLVWVSSEALRYQLLLKSLCVIQTEFSVMVEGGKGEKKSRQSGRKMIPSGICSPLLLHSAWRFVFAVMVLVQRVITRTDECPDLLVVNWETDGGREQRFNSLSMMCLHKWIFEACDVEHRLSLSACSCSPKTKEAHRFSQTLSDLTGTAHMCCSWTWSSVWIKLNRLTPTDLIEKKQVRHEAPVLQSRINCIICQAINIPTHWKNKA